MNQESISHKRLWAWLALAMSAPLAHFCAGSWLALLILGCLCLGAMGMLPGCWQAVKGSRTLCALEWIWAVLLLSQLMPLSAAYWPGDKSETVIPIVLLVLSAYSCSKRACRVAGVLFWVLTVMYLPVAVAGVKDMELSWLVPQSLGISLWMVPVLLLPCGTMLHGEKTDARYYSCIVLFGAALWAVAAGVLSPMVTGNLQTPFRELSRSLTVGAASRFESLLSVAVTLGWYGLGSILVRCGSVWCESIGVNERYAPWLTAAAAVGACLLEVRIPGEFAAVAAVAAWILVPALARKIFPKKREKSA